MTKKRIRITDGGIALPLGNNTFLMRGRLHSQGGIGIGNGGKNDIEVEDGEVVKFNKDNIQVLSDQPMLNGISPANALLAGGNFNKIFKVQQSINGNYGGSYGKDGLIKKLIGFFTGDAEKENTNKENKKDTPIDWDEIKIKQAYAESGFNSKAVSKAPAYGLYQITPQTLKEFNDKTGNAYKVEDLYNDKINTEIRDWYMNDLYNREWNTKNNPSDSVRATKTIMAYNMGPTSLVNRLNELKAKGYDIYQSLDWTQDDSIPVESREYNDFILRNINNSIGRNQLAYETSKKKNSDKVEGIRNGFKEGGVKKIIRQRLANNLTPIGYDDAINRIINTVLLNKKEESRVIDEEDKKKGDKGMVSNHRYALLSQYLQTPIDNIDNSDFIQESKYKPSLSKDKDVTYYTLIPQDNNESVYTLFNENAGQYTIGTGSDNNGDYMSLYDKWDIDPTGFYKDMSFGIGKPVELYDRFYKNDNPNLYNFLKHMYEYYIERDGKKFGDNVLNYEEYNSIYKSEALNNMKINNKNKVNNLNNNFQNGGQINMKLKYKNKQDITDIVMNEILPHSTGERKKFFTGGFWANFAANGVNSLLQGIVNPILNYNMANEIEKSGKDLQPAQMSKTYLDSRDHTLKHLLGDVDRTVNKFIDISSKNTNNSKTHMNRVRGLLSDALTKKQDIIGRSLNRSDDIKHKNAIMSQEVDKFNIANKNQFALINEQNRIDRQAAAMNARMAGNAAITKSIGSLLEGTGKAFYDYDKIGLSLLNSENTKAWDFFNEHWGKNWK